MNIHKHVEQSQPVIFLKKCNGWKKCTFDFFSQRGGWAVRVRRLYSDPAHPQIWLNCPSNGEMGEYIHTKMFEWKWLLETQTTKGNLKCHAALESSWFLHQ